ncbi:LOW QUALITY PROTEIN: hypothetical protein MC885_020722, partial [Smutsia gigantea]
GRGGRALPSHRKSGHPGAESRNFESFKPAHARQSRDGQRPPALGPRQGCPPLRTRPSAPTAPPAHAPQLRSPRRAHPGRSAFVQRLSSLPSVRRDPRPPPLPRARQSGERQLPPPARGRGTPREPEGYSSAAATAGGPRRLVSRGGQLQGKREAEGAQGDRNGAQGKMPWPPPSSVPRPGGSGSGVAGHGPGKSATRHLSGTNRTLQTPRQYRGLQGSVWTRSALVAEEALGPSAAAPPPLTQRPWGLLSARLRGHCVSARPPQLAAFAVCQNRTQHSEALKVFTGVPWQEFCRPGNLERPGFCHCHLTVLAWAIKGVN